METFLNSLKAVGNMWSLLIDFHVGGCSQLLRCRKTHFNLFKMISAYQKAQCLLLLLFFYESPTVC